MDLNSLTVSQIKALLVQPGGPAPHLLAAMANDKRSTVQELYQRYLVAREKTASDKKCARKMWEYELGFKEPGHNVVAGVDEVGRGPLAGPVLAAAVVLPAGCSPEGLRDSKKISPVQREMLDDKIKKMALDWAVGMATVAEIEKYNIHHAALLAMTRAVEKLQPGPDLVLVDGKFILPGINVDQRSVVGGDGLCPSIAAASVVAKVARDRLMGILDLLYPDYGFDRHKGYATDFHRAALELYGPCPIHRRGFAPVSCLIDGPAELKDNRAAKDSQGGQG